MLSLHGILVDHLENVVAGILKVDIFDMQSHLAHIITHEIKTLIHKPEGFSVAAVKQEKPESAVGN